MTTLAAPPHRTNADDPDAETFQLVSVESVKAPEGCAGADWFVYRIGQGVNEIVGYRQGNRESVRAEAEAIVVLLNERREGRKNKASSKTRRRNATAVRATPTE